ncbi:MAG TPA: hypothetical protein VGJ12_15715, partial [Gemmatimonadaceae bacterium]
TANPTVAAVTTTLKFASLAAGSLHTCGITADGTSYCWGDNELGQLGTTTSNGTTTANPTVTAVATTLKFASLTLGESHSCGLTADGTAYCWGYNEYGQLGTTTNNGTTNANPTVAAVNTTLTFASLTAGGIHTCGLTSDGTAYCWGNDVFGALGDNSGNKVVPTVTAVATTLKFASLAPGVDFTCGLTAGGAGYCWGLDQFGQLGDGMTSIETAPVAIGGVSFLLP